MFHAEGAAGFDLGYIEGFADGRAGISGNSASASGRARVRFNPPDSEWTKRLNPSNYEYKYSEGTPWKGVLGHLRYNPRQEKEVSKTLRSNITHYRNFDSHSGFRPISGGRNMYGFRRGYRRRVFRRRAVYRRRRFY